MRAQGKITVWKHDKGCGFITPSSGTRQVLRHKSRKEEFRWAFRLTVVVNVAVFLWLFTQSGSSILPALLTGWGGGNRAKGRDRANRFDREIGPWPDREFRIHRSGQLSFILLLALMPATAPAADAYRVVEDPESRSVRYLPNVPSGPALILAHGFSRSPAWMAGPTVKKRSKGVN